MQMVQVPVSFIQWPAVLRPYTSHGRQDAAQHQAVGRPSKDGLGSYFAECAGTVHLGSAASPHTRCEMLGRTSCTGHHLLKLRPPCSTACTQITRKVLKGYWGLPNPGQVTAWPVQARWLEAKNQSCRGGQTNSLSRTLWRRWSLGVLHKSLCPETGKAGWGWNTGCVDLHQSEGVNRTAVLMLPRGRSQLRLCPRTSRQQNWLRC